MNIKRILRHLLVTVWRVNHAFPSITLLAVDRAIKTSEMEHLGEIRFAVEGALDGKPLFKGQSARERAIDVFSQLRMWDTEYNNGVLIYLLLADRAVEIIADRGIHVRVDSQEWQKICREMEMAFKQANYEAGVVSGIKAVIQHLEIHFPAVSGDQSELPNKPAVL